MLINFKLINIKLYKIIRMLTFNKTSIKLINKVSFSTAAINNDILDSVQKAQVNNWSTWWSDEQTIDFNSMGYVITIADSVINVRGLNNIMLGEVV